MPSVSVSNNLLSTLKWISKLGPTFGMYLLRAAAKLGDMTLYFWVNAFHDETSCSCVNGEFHVSSITSSFFSASLRASLTEMPLPVTPLRRMVGAGVSGDGLLMLGAGLLVLGC